MGKGLTEISQVHGRLEIRKPSRLRGQSSPLVHKEIKPGKLCKTRKWKESGKVPVERRETHHRARTPAKKRKKGKTRGGKNRTIGGKSLRGVKKTGKGGKTDWGESTRVPLVNRKAKCVSDVKRGAV